MQQVWKGERFQELPDTLDEVLEFLEVDGPCAYGFRPLGEDEVYIKYTTLSMGTVYKRLFRGSGLFTYAPRVREFMNLERLRKQGVSEVEAVVAAEERRYGLVTKDLLVVRRLKGAVDLRTMLRDQSLTPEAEIAVARRTGKKIGELHESGFFHRDMFLRNILVTEGGIHFIDCRKGSWTPWPGRGHTYDLACLELWTPSFFSVEARRVLLTEYAAQTNQDPEALYRSIAGARASLVKSYYARKRKSHWLDGDMPLEEVSSPFA